MIATTTNQIKIKGYQDGLLITANHQDWKTLEDDIISHIYEREAFFHGAKIALDAGSLAIHAAEMGRLRDRLSEKGVTLWAVISTSAITINTAKMLGLDTSLERTRLRNKESGIESPEIGEEAIFIQRTLRSGMCINSEKSVIVLGDVNPGAEIITRQNIIVWGRLRGTAYAGKDGSQENIICALNMAPTLLRIGEIVSELPVKLKKSRPYTAKIIKGVIQFEPWD